MLIETENFRYALNYNVMFTLHSALAQATNLSQPAIFIINLVLYIVAIYIFYKKSKELSLEINFIVLILLTLTFCIHGLNHDLAILLLPMWLLIDIIKGNEKIHMEQVLVLLFIIWLPMFYILDIAFIVPFLFLLSAVLFYTGLNTKSDSLWMKMGISMKGELTRKV